MYIKVALAKQIYKIADEYIQKSLDQDTWRTPGDWFASVEEIEEWIKLITTHNNFYSHVTKELYKLGFHDETGNEIHIGDFHRMWHHGKDGLRVKGNYGVTETPISTLRKRRNRKRRAATSK